MNSELVVPETQAGNLIRPKQKRLTDKDKAFAMRAARDGWRQVDIASRLGVTQAAVSMWLSQCEDSRPEASQFLDGQALTIAQKAVKKGTATDLIKLLAGRGVVGDAENGPKIVINIGCQTNDVQVLTTSACASESESVINMTGSKEGQ